MAIYFKKEITRRNQFKSIALNFLVKLNPGDILTASFRLCKMKYFIFYEKTSTQKDPVP